MIESASVAPDVSAAARAMRAIPSAKRTAAVRANLAKANAARLRRLVELNGTRHYLRSQMPRFHHPRQLIKPTGVEYRAATQPLPRPSFVAIFHWISARPQSGLTRQELALLAAHHLKPANLGRFICEAIHHLKKRGLVSVE